MKPTLVILAAGMGSRYGGLKQIDKLGPDGETIMEYAVFDAIQAGFGKIVFVIRKSIEIDFLETFSGGMLSKIDFEIVFQELEELPDGFFCPPHRTKPWGTAHAVWVTRNSINEPFAVVNADDFYGREAYQTLSDFLQESTPDCEDIFAMNGYQLQNTLSEHGTVARGVCKVSEDGFLESVDEQTSIERGEKGKIISHLPDGIKELAPETTVSMNIWAFNPTIFEIIEDYLRHFLTSGISNPKAEMYTPALVDKMINEGKAKVKVLNSDAQWFGVTYAADKTAVKEKLQQLAKESLYPSPLWKKKG
ncbi:MAG: sugar phosphate nucleotidyltransferase [Bacteroidales bacterium]|nr:sugar phosphate nucleotidyltransferase [Bacteroidales bacterium]